MDLEFLHPDARRLVETSPPMPLVSTRRIELTAAMALRGAKAEDWFPEARHPEAALAGLWLRLGGWEEAHSIAQDLNSAEGSYWHAIVHRQEPDAWNSGYWFRRVGAHPIYPALLEQARKIATATGIHAPTRGSWDPIAFIDFCEQARAHPGTARYQAASQMQDAEWWLLFEFCAHATMEK